MELRQLEYVVSLAESHSFTEAARRCGVVQSALSHRLARLEEELGERLFERTTRAVRITQAGEALLPIARRILADVRLAKEEVEAISGLHRGRLGIGATQTASHLLDLVGVLGAYHRRYPEVKLVTVTGPGHEMVAMVAAGELDLALAARTLEPCPDHVEFHPLLPAEPAVAVVGGHHPLARRKRAGLTELAASGPFIEFRARTELRKRVDEAFRIQGVQREIAFELGQIPEMVRFAVAGLGIAIVPGSFARDLGDATALRLAERELSLTIGAYVRADGSSPATRTLEELLRSSRSQG
ncbi:LysR family transcriptional regulator [Amycolatopsis cynarae]|uniref:LysR family transcriptional regulator n=1 Tax=Amycolatopsis cynarae TaxID=2995223 RepID=A0ABY7BBL9_9PSEU|nr:LysR family transcriptional regulator [Amycolatopsis sp. HUAS 11-8]WAL69387.1 LysR family transcriptional regulator [Amycolatopsis sp. HUAS 11-8]